jgi:chromate transporter
MSFGGGLSSLLLVQQQTVDIYGWLTLSEYADIVTIAEMTPGPIGLNAATFSGMQIGGILGAIISTFAYILPAFVIVLLLAFLFYRYKNLKGVRIVVDTMKPAVVAFVAAAGLSILLLAFFGTNNLKALSFKNFNYASVGLFVAGLIALRLFKKVNPVFIILGAGLVGLAVYQFVPLP